MSLDNDGDLLYDADDPDCAPPVETDCFDGVDNDEDGDIDCADSDCEGQFELSACGIGECGAVGEKTCTNGDLVDTCTPGNPSSESCDGLDNDCNGQVDDGIPSEPTTCGEGECASTGETVCVNGDVVDTCTAGAGSTEVCDGVDNDCDGQVDEGLGTTATTCGTGACASTGELACVGGAMVDSCVSGAPSDEVCDNADNDCDGQVDEGDVCGTPPGPCEGYVPTRVSCGAGECAAMGFTTCTEVNGEAVYGDDCVPGVSSDEVCDQLDNDCDGQIDEGGVCPPPPTADPCEGFVSEPTTCGTGVCVSTGETTCTEVNGEAVIVDTCMAGSPSDEVCDQLDNDCDGQVDEGGVCPPPPSVDPCEGFVSEPTTCGTGLCASTGETLCTDVNGEAVILDTCEPGTPTTEIPGNGIDENCNGMDDDVVVQVPPPPTDDEVDQVDEPDEETHDEEFDREERKDDREDRGKGKGKAKGKGRGSDD